jgi:hypothetical protein
MEVGIKGCFKLYKPVYNQVCLFGSNIIKSQAALMHLFKSIMFQKPGRPGYLQQQTQLRSLYL